MIIIDQKNPKQTLPKCSNLIHYFSIEFNASIIKFIELKIIKQTEQNYNLHQTNKTFLQVKQTIHQKDQIKISSTFYIVIATKSSGLKATEPKPKKCQTKVN